MAILNIQPIQIGLVGVRPGMWSIRTNNTVSDILVSGYLTAAFKEGFSFNDGDLAAVITTATPSSSNVSSGWYQINNSNGVVSLSASSQPGDVTLPTIANHLAVYTNTTGGLSEDAAIAINGGSVQAGLSGTAGTLISYPATASKGNLQLAAVANTGNTNVVISNTAHGQATTYSIPDIQQANGNIVVSQGPVRMKSVLSAAAAGGAAAQSFTDAFCASTSVVIGNWVTQANPASVLTIVPGTGSFVVTSSANAGAGTFSYIILS